MLSISALYKTYDKINAVWKHGSLFSAMPTVTPSAGPMMQRRVNKGDSETHYSHLHVAA
jgi:hypothetical protein